MPDQICRRCAAPVRGLVCEYCGVLIHPPVDPAEERAAWAEFTAIMQTQAEPVRVDMLRHGFLPDSIPNLIEAGLHAVRLIDMNDTAGEVVQAAALRLKAVAAKLRVLPQTAESSQAVREFERVLADYRRADRKLNTAVLIGGIVMLVGFCGGFIWFLG